MKSHSSGSNLQIDEDDHYMEDEDGDDIILRLRFRYNVIHHTKDRSKLYQMTQDFTPRACHFWHFLPPEVKDPLGEVKIEKI